MRSYVSVANKLLVVMLGALTLSSQADDTDIYNSRAALEQLGIKPNILFLLDTSGSMNDDIDGDNPSATEDSKLMTMKETLLAFINDTDLQSRVRVGLGRFNNSSGSIIYPVTDLNSTTLPEIRSVIGDHDPRVTPAVYGPGMIASGFTPGIPTLYEGLRYFMGESVLYGLSRPAAGVGNQSDYRLSHHATMTGETHSTGNALCTYNTPGDYTSGLANPQSSSCRLESYSGSPTYVSPITDQCQPNHIVLLTDGALNTGVNETDVEAFLDYDNTGVSCANSSSAGQVCGTNIASFMNQDLEYDAQGDPITTHPINAIYKDANGVAVGNQGIITHTIGFVNSDPYLQTLADAGGGDFYYPDDEDELLAVFQSLFDEVLSVDSTFSAPAATINQFNRLNHRNEVYFALFLPRENKRWPGNVKKYRFGVHPTNPDLGNFILDGKGNIAVDPGTGFFFPSSQDEWDEQVAIPTEFDVRVGGAASQIDDAGPRNIFSYFGTSALTSNNNLLSYNGTVDDDDLGVAPGTGQDFVNWANGIDVIDHDGDNDKTEYRKEYGDPLHSRPVLVTYSVDGSDPRNPDNDELVMFFGTNEGYMHAIDAQSGEELWSFFLPENISKIADLMNNPQGRHVYGTDGRPSVWVNDVDGDGNIETGDHVYLYFGMRRGGRSYYALDVTNKTSPVLLWRIDNTDPDFTELGQTWSTPIKSQVNIDGTVTDVVFFSGGYDPNQDDPSNTIFNSVDSQGRAIYMVDATTGAMLWHADSSTHPNLDYSIPADLAIVDPGRTGLASQLYVPDTGGQVWRFEVNNGAPLGSNFITTRLVATLSQSGTAGARRFYQAVDVALQREFNTDYLAVTVGSGWRAKPLEVDVSNNFYMLKIPNPYSALPLGFTPISHSVSTDLFDATNNIIGEGTLAQQQAARSLLRNSRGWYIQLENNGEKVLSTPVTFLGNVLFATFEPTAQLDGCLIQAGTSRGYVVKLRDATPALDRNGDENFIKDDRIVDLESGSIVDEPVILFTDDSDGQVLGNDAQACFGVECFSLDQQRAIGLNWYDKE